VKKMKVTPVSRLGNGGNGYTYQSYRRRFRGLGNWLDGKSSFIGEPKRESRGNHGKEVMGSYTHLSLYISRGKKRGEGGPPDGEKRNGKGRGNMFLFSDRREGKGGLNL